VSTGEHDPITVTVDTTGLAYGPYHGDIAIITPNETAYFSVDLMVVASGTPLIDVEQANYDRGFPVRHALDGDWGAAQDFKCSMSTLSLIEICMRMFGTPEFDLTVELRADGPEGTLLDAQVFTPAEVPTSWDWFTIDFSDVAVDPESSYFIVLPPAPSGVSTSFGYEWGYAFGNQYDDGAFWFTRDGGGLWRDLPTMYEFAFKTYGIT